MQQGIAYATNCLVTEADLNESGHLMGGCRLPTLLFDGMVGAVLGLGLATRDRRTMTMLDAGTEYSGIVAVLTWCG